MRLVFDLDGVLRDLSGSICSKMNLSPPKKWRWEGIDFINKDLSILVEAPPTEFLGAAKEFFEKIEVWSSQPKEWQPYTNEWLSKNLGEKLGKIVYAGNPVEKEKLLQSDRMIYLVEDYPFFQNYERVFLIDRPYNRGVGVRIRIKTLEGFKKVCSLFTNQEEVNMKKFNDYWTDTGFSLKGNEIYVSKADGSFAIEKDYLYLVPLNNEETKKISILLRNQRNEEGGKR